jgi:hypothetical protein
MNDHVSSISIRNLMLRHSLRRVDISVFDRIVTVAAIPDIFHPAIEDRRKKIGKELELEYRIYGAVIPPIKAAEAFATASDDPLATATGDSVADALGNLSRRLTGH